MNDVARIPADQILGVREAATRLGVHENTVRNWVRDGKLDDVRLAGSRFLRIRSADVERMISQRGSAAVSLHDELHVMPPSLAGIAELTRWADHLTAWADQKSRDAQERLPELMRRLLLETPHVTSIRVESEAGIAQHGWDATFVVEQPHPALPTGEVVVEMGTNKDVRAKADHDYNNRAIYGPYPNVTFVFVSPRRWAAGADWARKRRNEGVFADVRVIDAPVLEMWLRQTPGAHHWLSEHLGLTSPDIQTLERWWGRFRTATDPVLPGDFFIAGRSREVEVLRELLEASAAVADRVSQRGRTVMPAHVRIATSWADDGYAFIRAAVRHRPEGESHPARSDSSTNSDSVSRLIAEPLMVGTSAAWDHITRSSGQSVLVPTFEDADVDAALNAGHSVISVAHRDHLRSGSDIDLPRLGREEAAQALAGCGVEFDAAHSYAALGRRSLPALVRTLARDHRRSKPAWASGAQARIYANLILAGGWSANDNDDRSALSELTAADTDVIADLVGASADNSDPLFRRSGDDWIIAAPEEALLTLAPRIGDTALLRWRTMATNVLDVPDPRDGLSENEWLAAQLKGARRRYSLKLRASVAYMAALLGTVESDHSDLDDRALAGAARTSRRQVGLDRHDAARLRDAAVNLVIELLTRAAHDASGETWSRLSPFLPRLAEAAPEVFLNAVEAGLSTDLGEPLLRTMFRGSSSSFLGPSSPHVHLLWALETLAWSDEYLVRAGRLLAQLTPLAADVSSGNHPLTSLDTILCGWTRHTTALFETRMSAIDAVIQTNAEVGWALLMRLWPSHHASSSPPARPVARDWEPDSGVPLSEWASFVREVVNRAARLAQGNAPRLTSLVDRLGPLPSAERAKVIALIETSARASMSSADERLALWEAVSSVVAKHRNYEDSDWAMDPETVGRLEVIAGTLDRTDDPRRLAQLFTPGPEHRRRPQGMDFSDWREEVNAMRRDAIADLLARSEPETQLARLAEHVENPYSLSWTLAEMPAVGNDLLLSWLDDELDSAQTSSDSVDQTRGVRDSGTTTTSPTTGELHGRRLAVAEAWLTRALAFRDVAFVAELLNRPDLSEAVHRRIVLAVPTHQHAWRLLDDRTEDVKTFWSHARIEMVPPEDTVEAVTRLLEHGRPWAAMEVCSFAWQDRLSQVSVPQADQTPVTQPSLDSELVIAVLREGRTRPQTPSDGRMSAHHVSELLDYLVAEGVGDEVLAPLEFAYLTLLDDQREPAALSRTLASEPDTFVDLVSKVYRGTRQLDTGDLSTNEQAEEEIDRVFAHHCWRVLKNWHGYPSQSADGAGLDRDQMRAWIAHARLVLSDVGRADIGDEAIGQALANSPADPDDGAWPHQAVRDLLEDIGSHHLESGLYTGRLNQRGVTWRGVYDGGRRERDIADSYRSMVPIVAGRWPRTTRMLGNIVRSYERDAERHDKAAERDADQY